MNHQPAGAVDRAREGPGPVAPAAGTAAAPVLILMGLHNGAAHLAEQLESFAAQTHADWRLLASDDGSADATARVVGEFALGQPPGRVELVSGPCRGHAVNYLHMLRRLPPDGGDWLAFSDQDDVWLPERLERGVAALRGVAGPAMYCSRTLICSEDLGERRLSPPRPRRPGFRNALVQNIAAGNTILVNPAGARLLIAAAGRVQAAVVHDWWAYQVISGAGGLVLHDDRPSLLYRQHSGNAIGSNDGLRSKLRRLRMLHDGTMRRWTDVNLAGLLAISDLLGDEERALVQEFAALRQKGGALRRLWRFLKLGLYRQTFASTAALWWSVLTRRV